MSLGNGRLVLICGVCLVSTTSAMANAIRYSTSGTVAISNEPNPVIQGLTDVPITDPGAIQSSNGTSAPGTTFRLGAIPVEPWFPLPRPGQVSHAPPDFSNAPFDLRLTFDDPSLPGLELRGAFRTDSNGIEPFSGYPSHGTVSSITSLAPLLNANLPAPFSDMLAHPERVDLYSSFPDFDVTSADLLANVRPVPEPSSLVILGVGAALIVTVTRRARGVKSGPGSS